MTFKDVTLVKKTGLNGDGRAKMIIKNKKAVEAVRSTLRYKVFSMNISWLLLPSLSLP